MNSLICKIIGHKYTKKDNSPFNVNDYVCKSCDEKFTTDGYGTIVKLTPFWKENNLLFKQYAQEHSV